MQDTYAAAAGEEWEGKPLEDGDEAMVAVVSGAAFGEARGRGGRGEGWWHPRGLGQDRC
jgi:hypothetical protein